MDKSRVDELMNVQTIASLRIALRIIQDTDVPPRAKRESELKETAYNAVYAYLQYCENKP